MITAGRRCWMSTTRASIPSFRSMDLPAEIRRVLVKNNTLVPTDIQNQSLNRLIDGESLILLSETGSGKTLSYVLPMIVRSLNAKANSGASKDDAGESTTGKSITMDRSPAGLIIAPTSELARQVSNVVQKYSDGLPIKHQLLMPAENSSSIYMPHSTDIAITTWSWLRQLSHLIPSIFKSTQSVAVDEADWVLGDGYRNKLHKPLELFESLARIKPTKQFIFACATLPKGPLSARQVIQSRIPSVGIVSSVGSHRFVPTLTQHFVRVSNENKYKELMNLIREDQPGSKMLVFANSIRSLQQAHAYINAQIESMPNLADRISLYQMHTDVRGPERDATLDEFSSNLSNKMHVMLTTDVLTRGFDFPDVDRVVQLDLATNAVTFIHRAGRTARANRQGEMLNLVAEDDEQFAQLIQEAMERDNFDPNEFDKKHLAQLFSRRRSLRDKLRRRAKSAHQNK